MLEPTLAAFPRDPATKDAAGVPFGCVAQPLAPFTDYVLAEDELEHADAVARCDSCFGYISSHCQFLRHHWRCSLCGALNPTPARYATARRDKLPELADAAVELRLGEFAGIGNEGLNLAPWPLYTYEVLPVTRENVINIGQNAVRSSGGSRQSDMGLMLTGDENIVDVDYQVVWNIADPARFLFNLAEPEATIRAVSEAAMREVIGKSELAPILNRDRAIVSQDVQALIQSTLDGYEAGVNIVRVNFDKADPPREVIDAFRDVQAAGQDRVRSENTAEAYANRALAEARGQSAQLVQEAEAYNAQTVNDAQGDAARFLAILTEYRNAEDVTRKRLYLETMERVLGDVDKIVIENGVSGSGDGGGGGVLPYLPLDQLRKGGNQ